MGKLRSLAPEEEEALYEKKRRLHGPVRGAVHNFESKSKIKKLQAIEHNEWQKYLKDNAIVTLCGKIFTEKETLIDGTIEILRKQNEKKDIG